MSISRIIDVAAILLVIFMVMTSYRKGFVRSVVELVGYVVAAVAARVLCVPAGNWLYTNFLRADAGSLVSKYLSSLAAGTGEGLGSLLAQYHIPSGVLSAQLPGGTAQITADTASSALMSGVVDPIGLAVGRGIAFVVIFFLVLWIIGIVAAASQALNRIPVLGAVNRLFGAAAGVVKAALVLFVLAAAVAAVLPLSVFSGQAAAVRSVLSHSAVYLYVDRINPLKDVLLKG